MGATKITSYPQMCREKKIYMEPTAFLGSSQFVRLVVNILSAP